MESPVSAAEPDTGQLICSGFSGFIVLGIKISANLEYKGTNIFHISKNQ